MSGSSRKMVPAKLLGQHTHQATGGTNVHIWLRQGMYLARGRYEGRGFGESLGNADEAVARLRRLLVSIEDGSYVRPSDARTRPLKRRTPPQLDIPELCDSFLLEKRQTRGQATAATYQQRLTSVIEFADQAHSRRLWPKAVLADRRFAIELRTFLCHRLVTANGRLSSAEKRMSPRQIFNILDCARSVFHWAKRPDVGLLPASFVNPLSTDIVGQKPTMDPLRLPRYSLEQRISLIKAMDAWQLSQFAMVLVLPLRPEDYAGILVSEVNLLNRLLTFGTRLGGRDFTKGKVSFVCPFPPEIAPLIEICIGGRAEGPLLRRRRVAMEQNVDAMTVQTHPELVQAYETLLANTPGIQTPQDCKGLFRRLLRRMGGISENGLAKEFKLLLQQAGLSTEQRFYDLRGSISTDLNRAGVSHLVQRYVTGHTTSDIMNSYVSLDPVTEFKKYFTFIQQLLDAISDQARLLGLGASPS